MAVIGMGAAHYIITDSVQSLQRGLRAQWPRCRGDAHFTPVGSARAEEGALRVSNRGLRGWRGHLCPRARILASLLPFPMQGGSGFSCGSKPHLCWLPPDDASSCASVSLVSSCTG